MSPNAMMMLMAALKGLILRGFLTGVSKTEAESKRDALMLADEALDDSTPALTSTVACLPDILRLDRSVPLDVKVER